MATLLKSAGDTITKLTLQSQAGWVLVTGALLADSLERVLLTKMRTLSNKKAKQIVKNGPLRNLAAKIDLAWAFELVDDRMHHDLTVIRDIRNEFAHSITEVNFDSPEVIKHMKKFKGWNVKLDQFELFLERFKSCFLQITAKHDQESMAKALRKKRA
jgi:DNA-binding MltR family transcriptional regulator